jgi:V/A-type H+/Na+-transporting ATPase subunit F
MEGKVAILGDADFVMPFSALGVDTYAVGRSRELVAEAAERIIAAEYALLVVAEDIAAVAQEVLSKTETKPTPCVVVVPFTMESEGFATEALSRVLKVATGIDILKSS